MIACCILACCFLICIARRKKQAKLKKDIAGIEMGHTVDAFTPSAVSDVNQNGEGLASPTGPGTDGDGFTVPTTTTTNMHTNHIVQKTMTRDSEATEIVYNDDTNNNTPNVVPQSPLSYPNGGNAFMFNANGQMNVNFMHTQYDMVRATSVGSMSSQPNYPQSVHSMVHGMPIVPAGAIQQGWTNNNTTGHIPGQSQNTAPGHSVTHTPGDTMQYDEKDEDEYEYYDEEYDENDADQKLEELFQQEDEDEAEHEQMYANDKRKITPGMANNAQYEENAEYEEEYSLEL